MIIDELTLNTLLNLSKLDIDNCIKVPEQKFILSINTNQTYKYLFCPQFIKELQRDSNQIFPKWLKNAMPNVLQILPEGDLDQKMLNNQSSAER